MSYVVGSAEVELVPSAQGFDEKVDALVGNLSVGIQLDPDILGLRARIAEISDLRVGVDTDLHDTAVKAELDVLTRDRGVHIIPELVSGVVSAELDILTRPRTVEITPVELPAVGGGGGAGGAGGLAALLGNPETAAVMAVGITDLVAAMVPIASVAAGAALGLGALLSAAGLGVGVFAGLTVAALATDNAFKSQLQPSLDGLKSAFDSFVNANQGALLAPLQAGLQLLASILPQLSPLLNAASQAIVALLKPLQDAVNSGAFSNFVAQITPLVGPAITGFGKILENVTVGIGNMMGAFAPFGKTVLDGLVKLSATFATFAGSKAFQDFLSDVMKQLPIVTNFFSSLFAAVGPLLPILAQLGMQVLAALGPQLKALAPLLQALIPLFVAMTPVIIEIVSAYVSFQEAVMSVVVPALNFIIGVVVVVINWFQGFLTWIGNLVSGNQQGGQQLMDIWNGVTSFFSGVGAFFAGIWNNLVNGVRDMANNVIDWFQQLPDRILSFFSGVGDWLWNAGQDLVNGFWNGIKNMWSGFTSWIQGMINAIPKAVRDVLGIASPSKVFAEIGMFVGQGLQQGMDGSLSAALDSARTKLRAGVGALTATASAAVTATVDATALGGGSATVTLGDKIDRLLQATLDQTSKMATDSGIARATRVQARTGGAV